MNQNQWLNLQLSGISYENLRSGDQTYSSTVHVLEEQCELLLSSVSAESQVVHIHDSVIFVDGGQQRQDGLVFSASAA